VANTARQKTRYDNRFFNCDELRPGR